MNKKTIALIFLSIIFFSITAGAACPEGTQISKEKGLKAALTAYQHCAISENDDEAQVVLARLYQKGGTEISPNLMKTLLYYHLAADNGNAAAQTELAKLLLRLDKSDAARIQLISYLKQIQIAFQNDRNATFKGEILHPYVLLTLAAEKQDQKWYYPTRTKVYPESTLLLRSYELSDERKKELLRQGSTWKQRKILESAKEVLPMQEYQIFYETLYPAKGMPDAFSRKQALENLKEKIRIYLGH